jgi:hypothetical protein
LYVEKSSFTCTYIKYNDDDIICDITNGCGIFYEYSKLSLSESESKSKYKNLG